MTATTKPIEDWAAFASDVREAGTALVQATEAVETLVERADEHAGEAADAALGKLGGTPGFLTEQARLMQPKLNALAAAVGTTEAA